LLLRRNSCFEEGYRQEAVFDGMNNDTVAELEVTGMWRKGISVFRR
jgi:hypothetical protein